MDLLTVGEAFEDLVMAGLARLPRLGEEARAETLTLHPGGGAIITAIAAARLGLRVGAISAVSAANAVRLRAERVTLTNLRRAAEPGAVTVALSTRRDRAFATFDGVNRVLEPRLIRAMTHLSRRPRHVHFALGPRRLAAWVTVVDRLRRKGITTSWDFGWNRSLASELAFQRLLAAVDWVFVNDREALLYSGTNTLMRALDRWQTLARGTIVKLGRRGAVGVTSSSRTRMPAFKMLAVDTTGAGDAFDAGFLAALLAGASLDEALRVGNYLGAQSTRVAGGVDGLPLGSRLPAWTRRILEGA